MTNSFVQYHQSTKTGTDTKTLKQHATNTNTTPPIDAAESQ
ncbi:hypothetical protein [Staphylococcus aureus]|nr:hypothetical protein [Staphylococcus aureus]